MRHLRLSLPVAALSALTLAAGAYAQGRGLTHIMGAGPGPSVLRAPPVNAAPPQPQGQRPAEYIVALVNSEPITNTEVQLKIQRALRQGGPEVQRIPPEQLARAALERIISEKAQLQAANERGIKVDDLAVDQAEQMVARQNQVSVTELRRRVAAEGMTVDTFRNELRSQLLLSRLREREVEPKVTVSDLEVDQFLQDQSTNAGASTAENINMAHLLVAVPEGASDADVEKLRQKAEGLAKRARAGEDFAALARESSDAPDKQNGGVLGQRRADRYPPLFVEATQSTPEGGVAGPVRSGAGFHVLKVLSKSQLGAKDATVTQTQVRHILLRTDANRTTAQAVAELNDFKRRIEAGTATFEGLARDNSADGSAKQGGELGWSRPGQFVPEFEEAMNRLQPGQVSDPVVSRFGVHLIQVEARREAKLSQEEQRAAARSALRDKRMEEAYETWTQEVRARAYVEYRDAPQS